MPVEETWSELPAEGANAWAPVLNSAATNLNDRLMDIEATGMPAWLIGEGAPTADLGHTGYLYLDKTNGDLYQKTDAVTWVFEVTIKGAQGEPGEQGLPGPNAVPTDEAIGAAVGSDSSDSAAAVDARIDKRMPFATPEMFGAVGDGTTDDHDPVQAAIDALHAAGGGTLIPHKRYGWTGDLIVRGGVNVVGASTRRIPTSEDNLDRGLVALDSTATIKYGYWATAGSLDDNPGALRDLVINGNGTGVTGAGTGLVEMQCVDGAIENCSIVGAAGNDLQVGGAQNSRVVNCRLTGAGVSAVDFITSGSQGAGQVKFRDCYIGTSRYLLTMDSDPAQWYPHDIRFVDCLFEQYTAGNDLIWLKAGITLKFARCTFSNSNAGTPSLNTLIKIQQTAWPTVGTGVQIDSCEFNGGAATTKPLSAVTVESASGGVGNIVRFTGDTTVQNTQSVVALAGATQANYLSIEGTINRVNNQPWYDLSLGGSPLGIYRDTASPVHWKMPNLVGLYPPIRVGRYEDAGDRFWLDRDGGLYWGDGTNPFVTKAAVLYDSTLSALKIGGLVSLFNGWGLRNLPTYVSGAGVAVAFSAASTSAPAGTITFQANSSSANVTISDGTHGSQLQIAVSTAGYSGCTVSWPAGIIWQGTAPQPADNSVMVIDLVKIGSLWVEKGRVSTGGGAVDSVNGHTGTVVLDAADVGAVTAAEVAQLVAWAKVPDSLITGSITRNDDGVITSADVVWPDGTTGTFTTDTIGDLNTIDAYHITYEAATTKTFTQGAITRDDTGAATSVPAITIS